MSYFLARSLAQLRAEVNTRWPKRSKVSDGWIGDASHQARKSDHNPDWDAPDARRGVVRALDITTADVDVDLLLKHTTNDSRVAYVIYNRRIYQHRNGWQPYNGSNPHTNHVHVSIAHTATAENETKLWFGSASTPVTKPAASKPSTTTVKAPKSVATMAAEVIAGKHGNGHAARQRSLGVNAATYAKVRAEVNRRAGVTVPAKSVATMAAEVIAGKHGNGHAARRKSLGISAALYAQVRAEVNRRA